MLVTVATYKMTTAMDLVSEVSKSRPSQVWFSNRRTRQPVESEMLCVTVADSLDDHSNEPGVSGQQVQAQPGMVQQAQDRADRKKVLKSKPPKQIPCHSEVCPPSHPQSPRLLISLLSFLTHPPQHIKGWT